ncbi:hypothetical protein F8M41_007070 [Gigaspora margarita]|uniref:Uncharacterized protein n=1 Tax=Gigaspora margarita TaxID=4874 RepID=A0A8H4AWH9_GIGMA|nr:hypothetical protein F8M41_007070 [Gigaspora margarita]
MGQTTKSKLTRLDKAILAGQIVKDEKIEEKFRDLRERIEKLDRHYAYATGLTENEVEKLLKEKYKVDTSVGKKAELSEGRKEYFYNYLSELEKTNDATLYVNREEIEELHVYITCNM